MLYQIYEIGGSAIDTEEAAVDHDVIVVEITWKISGEMHVVRISRLVNVSDHLFRVLRGHVQIFHTVFKTDILRRVNEDADQKRMVAQNVVRATSDNDTVLTIREV